MPDGVLEQVSKHATDLGDREISDARVVEHVPLQPDTLALGRHAGVGQGVRDELGEGDRLEAEAQSVGLDAAQLEQVVDKPGEAVGFALDRGEVALDRLGIVDDAVVQRLDYGPDARQRGAQIVRHPRDQHAP